MNFLRTRCLGSLKLFERQLLSKNRGYKSPVSVNYLPLYYFSMGKVESKKIIDTYILNFENKSGEEFNDYVNKTLNIQLENDPEKILNYLAEIISNKELSKLHQNKILRTSQLLAKVLHDQQKRKAGAFLKLKTKKGFYSLVEIIKFSPGNFALSFSTEVILNNFAQLLKEGIIKPDDFEEAFEEMLDKNKRVLHSKMFPKDAGNFIIRNLLQHIERKDCIIRDELISKVSDFVHSFRDIQGFKTTFSTLRTLLQKFILAKLKDTENITTVGSHLNLLVNSLDYLDSSPKEIISILTQVNENFKKNSQISQENAYTFIIDSFSKLSQSNIEFVNRHLIPIYSHMLNSEDIKFCNFNSLSLEDIRVLGEIINTNKLSAGSIFNILVASLDISKEEKASFSISKTRHNYEIKSMELGTSEYLKMYPDDMMNNMIMTPKDLNTIFFVKYNHKFTFKGLLLILLLCLEKSAALGKYETFLYSELKHKTKNLTQEEVIDTIAFLKTTAKQKNKFLAWVNAFEDGITKVFQQSDPSTHQAFIDLMIRGRIDLTQSPFRNFDILLDYHLSSNFQGFNQRSIDLILSNLVAAKVQSFMFYQIILENFEKNFRVIQLQSSITILLKLNLIGMKVKDEVYQWIVKGFLDYTQKGMNLPFTIPFKLLASILLGNKFDKFSSKNYDTIFSAMINHWEEQFTEFEKEEVFGTNFVNNQLLFLRYIELFFPDYYKSYFLSSTNGQKLLHLTKGKSSKKFSISGGKMESDLSRIIKKTSNALKIQENTFILDGLLECDLILKNEKNSKELIVEFFGPSHFVSNSSFYFRETTRMILEIKRTIKPVVVVPLFEWLELKEEEKAEYVKVKILSHLD